MITRFAIENDRVTWAVLVSLLFAGTAAYFNLPRAMDPGFIIRAAQIVTVFPGASPERVEQLVTEKVEKAAQELPELDFVFSTSKTGQSIVIVNIQEKYTDMRPIWDKLRRKVDNIRGSLPEDVIGPDVNDEFGDTYGIVVNITGDGFSPAEIKDVADELRDELLLIPEVSKVELLGGARRTRFHRIRQRAPGRAQSVAGPAAADHRQPQHHHSGRPSRGRRRQKTQRRGRHGGRGRDQGQPRADR